MTRFIALGALVAVATWGGGTAIGLCIESFRGRMKSDWHVAACFVAAFVVAVSLGVAAW